MGKLLVSCCSLGLFYFITPISRRKESNLYGLVRTVLGMFVCVHVVYLGYTLILISLQLSLSATLKRWQSSDPATYRVKNTDHMKFVCLLANIGCCQLFCCIQIACDSISQISSRFFQLYILHFLCFVRKKQKQDETTTATYYDNRQRPGCGLSVPKQIASAGEKGWTLVNGSRCYEWTGCDFVVGCGWCLKGGHLRDVFAYLETWLFQAVWDLHFKIYVEKVCLKGYYFRCVSPELQMFGMGDFLLEFGFSFSQVVRISQRLCFKLFYRVFFHAWDGQISHGIVMDTQKWLWYNVYIVYIYIYTSWGTQGSQIKHGF